MNTYEIYSDKFSQIITAHSLASAVREFMLDHPNQEVIAAESCLHREKEVKRLGIYEVDENLRNACPGVYVKDPIKKFDGPKYPTP